jgi:hypothetical protein
MTQSPQTPQTPDTTQTAQTIEPIPFFEPIMETVIIPEVKYFDNFEIFSYTDIQHSIGMKTGKVNSCESSEFKKICENNNCFELVQDDKPCKIILDFDYHKPIDMTNPDELKDIELSLKPECCNSILLFFKKYIIHLCKGEFGMEFEPIFGITESHYKSKNHHGIMVWGYSFHIVINNVLAFKPQMKYFMNGLNDFIREDQNQLYSSVPEIGSEKLTDMIDEKINDVFDDQIYKSGNQRIRCPFSSKDGELRPFKIIEGTFQQCVITAFIPSNAVFFNPELKQKTTNIHYTDSFKINETDATLKNEMSFISLAFEGGMLSSNSTNYGSWLNVAFFLKGRYGNTNDSYKLFDIFSKMGGKKYDKFNNQEIWNNLNPKMDYNNYGIFVNMLKKYNKTKYDVLDKQHKQNSKEFIKEQSRLKIEELKQKQLDLKTENEKTKLDAKTASEKAKLEAKTASEKAKAEAKLAKENEKAESKLAKENEKAEAKLAKENEKLEISEKKKAFNLELIEQKKLAEQIELEELKTQLETTLLDSEDFKAMEILFNLYPYWKCYEEMLFVYDDDTGMWSSDISIQNKIISRYVYELTIFRVFNNKLERTSKSYGGCHNKRKDLIHFIKQNCVDKNWVNETESTSLGKVLFTNGHYDFKKMKFFKGYAMANVPEGVINGFNPEIVFYVRLNYSFDENLDCDDLNYIESVKTRLFDLPLGNVSNYVIENLSRGLAGEQQKRLLIGLGKGNTGKGILTKASQSSLGQLCGIFTADNLTNTQKSGDSGQQTRWIFLLRWKRLCFSNEIDIKQTLNSTTMKMMCSGGDTMIGRIHGGVETNFSPQFITVVLANDLPEILPYDEQMDDRVRVFNMTKQFVDNPVNEFQLKKDYNLENEMKTLKFQKAFVRVLIDANKKFQLNKCVETEPIEITESKEDWFGSKETNNIFYKFNLTYELSNKSFDFVESSEIEKWIKKEGSMTYKNFVIQLSQHCKINNLNNIIKKSKKTNNKQAMTWFGIKLIEELKVEEVGF